MTTSTELRDLRTELRIAILAKADEADAASKAARAAGKTWLADRHEGQRLAYVEAYDTAWTILQSRIDDKELRKTGTR